MRTWVWVGLVDDEDDPVWITQLGEGRYLRCTHGGQLFAYECLETPAESPYSSWEEV